MSSAVSKILDILAAPTLPSINQQPITSTLGACEAEYEKEKLEEKEIYNVDNLNVGQRKIFDYIHEHPDHTIIIQGEPGTGKTFTLMTIGHAWESPVNAIIYKHDLLRPFKYIAHRYTVARFIMDLWGLQFEEYQSLEYEFSKDLSGLELATCMATLLSRAKMPDFKGSLVILDEYAMIPKPLLLLILTLLRHYQIGTVICGDRNQLESIHNSHHADCSSFDIASRYAHAVFVLDKNERCSDRRYNDIIKYVSRFASSKMLDQYAYAIVAAIFPRQLYGTTVFSDIHLAARHRNLAFTAHELVIKEKIPTSLYTIIPANSALRNFLQQPEYTDISNDDNLKFLPYLPLAVGTLYYANKHSKMSHAILTDVDEENEILTLQKQTKSGEKIQVEKNTCDEVMFTQHRETLLANVSGTVQNYPIYPANIMTFYKCQGCTVKQNLDIDLNEATYQHMYVALSRVNSPEHIVRVIVPNYIRHLVSTIVCFDEHTTGEEITADTIDVRMKYYKFYHKCDEDKYIGMVKEFFNAETFAKRLALREELVGELDMTREPRETEIFAPPLSMETDISDTLMQKFIDYLPVFVALSQVDEIERHVWLHEFALCTSDMYVLRDELERSTYRGCTPILNNLAGLRNSYSLEKSSVEYIESHSHVELYKNSPTQLVLERLESEKVRVTRSRFLFNVHAKLKQSGDYNQTKSAITPEWLIYQLNDMMKNG